MRRSKKRRYEAYSDLFINFAAAAFGSVLLFPGLLGFKSVSDVLILLIVNIPFGIVSMLIALKLKEEMYA